MTESLKGERILCWGTKIHKKKKPELHPLYKNHRCQHAVVYGGGGRVAYCLVVKDIRAHTDRIREELKNM